MKKKFAFITTVTLVVVLLAACNNDSSEKSSDTTIASQQHSDGSHTEHAAMMKKMMDDMNAVKMTGDFDLDFASMMIPHHQSAVDMAEDYLPNAKDEKIKLMAQNIINAQKKEIDELKKMIADHKPAPAKEEAYSGDSHPGSHNELNDAMNKMMDKMKSNQMSGNPDKDFVTMMIPHHQSAVDMAENEISHGKNIEIKKFAQKVIDDQTREINEFEAWLKAQK